MESLSKVEPLALPNCVKLGQYLYMLYYVCTISQLHIDAFLLLRLLTCCYQELIICSQRLHVVLPCIHAKMLAPSIIICITPVLVVHFPPAKSCSFLQLYEKLFQYFKM